MNTMMRGMLGAVAVVGIVLGGLGCDGLGGESVCEAFLDEEAPVVTIRFTNASAQPLFVGSQVFCADPPPFTLLNANGEVLDIDGSGCGTSCENMQENGLITCPDVCQVPAVHMIAPGGHFDAKWNGTLKKPVVMPASCVQGGAEEAQSCIQRVTAPRSLYTVEAQAFTEAFGCGPDGDMCTCTPSADGSCQVPATGFVSGFIFPEKATLNYPDVPMIELVWD